MSMGFYLWDGWNNYKQLEIACTKSYQYDFKVFKGPYGDSGASCCPWVVDCLSLVWNKQFQISSHFLKAVSFAIWKHVPVLYVFKRHRMQKQQSQINNILVGYVTVNWYICFTVVSLIVLSGFILG